MNLAERLGYATDDRVLILSPPGPAGRAATRAMDYELFRDRSIAEQLESLGIHTVTHREIRDRYRTGSLANDA